MYLSYYNAVQGKSSATVFSRLHPGEGVVDLSKLEAMESESSGAKDVNEMDLTTWPRKYSYGKHIYYLL